MQLGSYRQSHLAGRLLDGLRNVRDTVRRMRKRAALRRQSRRSRPLRIVIGWGGVPVEGWILTDIEQLNILNERDWRTYFSPGSIDSILAEHIWEHLTIADGVRAAELCRMFLREGGRLRVAVPDGCHPSLEYRESARPGGHGLGADDHKVLYTWQTLRDVFERAGFRTRFLEYFDEHGVFHATDWNPADGVVRRSERFDPRNRDGKKNYTSIILDAVKMT